MGMVERATLHLGPVTVEVEPVLPVHLGVGTGYGFDADGWKHGAYQGELAVQGRTWDLRSPDVQGSMFGIVDAVARCTIVGPGGDRQEGWGLLEWLHV
jgi:hypothetical protein